MISTFVKNIWDGIRAWFTWVYSLAANWIPWLALLQQWLTGKELRQWAWLTLALKVLASAAVLIYTLSALLGSLVDVEAALNSLVATLDSISLSIQALPVGPILAKANRVFPLSEFLGFLVIIITVRILALGVRVALKFVPFIG
jgi:hypothetical protein